MLLSFKVQSIELFRFLTMHHKKGDGEILTIEVVLAKEILVGKINF
jgi:hypothetical protein